MNEYNPRDAYTVCATLKNAMSGATSKLSIVPGLIIQVIEKRCWTLRVDPLGDDYKNTTFEEFITKPWPSGLGITRKQLIGVCTPNDEMDEETQKECTDALDAIYTELDPGGDEKSKGGSPPGGNNPEGKNQHPPREESAGEGEASGEDAIDNIHGILPDTAPKKPNGRNPTGTSREAALRRLRKDRPDLYERVKSQELSAHAASIEAGFRKKETPQQIIRRAWKKLTDAERGEMLKELMGLS